MMTKDELYIQRCLDIATLGKGKVSPNPLVGAVLEYDGKIISEGAHLQYGAAHAEVNCLRHLSDRSLLQKATLYVSLEPCSHHGKTPPCADLIVHSGIKKVVIANTDPNPIVAGRGIARLEQNGIEVVKDVLAEKAKQLNKPFFVNQRYKRPYIILKWAESEDGYIAAAESNEQHWLSNHRAKILSHQWRSEIDAIAVGKNTVLTDNPALTTRLVSGRNPMRLIFDHHLSIHPGYTIFDRSAKTIVANQLKEERTDTTCYLRYTTLGDLMPRLLNEGIGILMVEGGAALLHSFFNENYWDEIRIFQTKKRLQNGLKPPQILQKADNTTVIDDNLLLHYTNTLWTI